MLVNPKADLARARREGWALGGSTSSTWSRRAR